MDRIVTLNQKLPRYEQGASKGHHREGADKAKQTIDRMSDKIEHATERGREKFEHAKDKVAEKATHLKNVAEEKRPKPPIV